MSLTKRCSDTPEKAFRRIFGDSFRTNKDAAYNVFLSAWIAAQASCCQRNNTDCNQGRNCPERKK